MTKEDILKSLVAIFQDVLRREDIALTYQTTASDVSGWDSLSNMKIIVQIEEQFNTRFNFREVLKFKNVGDLCDAIISRVD